MYTRLTVWYYTTVCCMSKYMYATVRLRTCVLCYCMPTHKSTMPLYAYAHVYYATVYLRTNVYYATVCLHTCVLCYFTHNHTFSLLCVCTYTNTMLLYTHAQFTIVYMHIYSATAIYTLSATYYTTPNTHALQYLMKYCQVHVI